VQIKNRQQVLIYLALGALIFFVGDQLIFEPVLNGWQARSKRIDELKKSIHDGDMMIKREDFIREHWRQMQTNTLSSNPSTAQGQVLKAFERWSHDSGVKVGSIKPQWKRSDEFTTLECRANATGDMRALSKFLYDAEKDPLAVKVDSVEISSHDNNGQQLSLVLQVSGLVLNQPGTSTP
jgi:Tfp pilus assembly protein PilO